MKILFKISILLFFLANIAKADLIKPSSDLKPLDVLMIQLNSLKDNNNKIITAHSTDRHYDYYSLIYSQLEPDTSYKPNEQSERPKCREYVNETQFVLQECQLRST